MRRWLGVLLVLGVLTTACDGDDGGETASPSTTATTPAALTTVAPVTTAAPATQPPTTARPAITAATAVIEPNAVAGIALGSNKSQAIAVLGPPTLSGQETDVSGAKYDFLRWQFSGNRGLFLNFRTESVTSPLLTDWIATAAGPRTTAGVQVGDGAAQAVAGHGPLQAFCCNAQVASVTQGGGRMIVVVDTASQTVAQIIGGDPAYWSRSIAD